MRFLKKPRCSSRGVAMATVQDKYLARYVGKHFFQADHHSSQILHLVKCSWLRLFLEASISGEICRNSAASPQKVQHLLIPSFPEAGGDMLVHGMRDLWQCGDAPYGLVLDGLWQSCQS
ncbi:hypothetical protein AVEN_164813-1 [Araneus ventricosus]|uniref:Uncharacterized protein n=1 Tax=Araneus ventricosus TaxID=182803 RepID=A0A4Y2W235_ARAVE|nr:hypothetical protein AVEN_164813-1 [Araneus ventricosus]